MMSEETLGYVGQDDVSVGVALFGVLHIENGDTFTALCNGRQLSYRSTREKILTDPGFIVRKLRICKRCEKRQLDA